MRKTILLLLCILLTANSYAQIYADVNINIKEDGYAVISGETNYPDFQNDNGKFTLKAGDSWFVNITTPVFDEFVYNLKLPKHATINLIKSNTQIKIRENSGYLTITSAGINEKISIFVEYSIDRIKQFDWLIWTAIIAAILAIGFWTFRTAKKLPKKKEIDKKRYTDRQLLIISYIQKHGSVTQAELEKALNLPKSSLSRNIETLVQKGLLFKETKGMSNVIGFKE